MQNLINVDTVGLGIVATIETADVPKTHTSPLAATQRSMSPGRATRDRPRSRSARPAKRTPNARSRRNSSGCSRQRRWAERYRRSHGQSGCTGDGQRFDCGDERRPTMNWSSGLFGIGRRERGGHGPWLPGGPDEKEGVAKLWATTKRKVKDCSRLRRFRNDPENA
jgi:hypothetical protein